MSHKRTGTWVLQRYLLGELPPSKMEEVARLAEEDPDLKREIQNLQQANAEMMRRNPPDTMLPQILKRYEANLRQAQLRARAGQVKRKRLYWAAPVLASALALLLVFLFKDGTGFDPNRVKGEESLDFTKTQVLIYRKTGTEVKRLSDGDRVKAGDLLQLGYIPAGKSYGVIFSIDGNGVVTLHQPRGKSGSSRLKQGNKSFLAAAYELDDAPGFERFFFVTAMTEIEVPSILRQAEGLAASPASVKTANLDLPRSYGQFSILLKKGKDND